MASPLTKIDSSAHKPYVRRAAIEAEIDHAIRQADDELIARAQVFDRNDPAYLHSETLVHLHRRAVRNGKPGDSFAIALIARCEANLNAKIAPQTPQAGDLRKEILSEFSVRLAEDAFQRGDEMDYYECMFNHAFATLRIDLFNKHVARMNKTASPPADVDDVTEGDIFVPGAKGMPAAGTWTRANAENLVYLREVLAFIRTLPADLQEVLVLCRIKGWTQERAADALSVDVKTIFNRLKRADLELASVKEDAL